MKYKDNVIYITTVFVIVIVYLIIYFFGVPGSGEYQPNVPGTSKQPINHILSKHHDNKPPHDNGHHHNNDDNDDEDDDDDDKILFEYDALDEDYIELYNQFPTADEIGKAFSGNKYTQNFRIRLNTYASGVQYTITIRKEPESTLENKWAKVYLETEGAGITNCFRSNGRVKTFNEYVNYSDDVNEKVLYKGKITAAEAERGYKIFTLRMWVSEDLKLYNEALLEETFKTRLTVYANK